MQTHMKLSTRGRTFRYGVLAATVAVGGCTADHDDAGPGDDVDTAPVGQVASSVIVTPGSGGPYGNLPTYQCSSSSTAYCHEPTGPAPIGSTSSQVSAYLDNAARNWGCNWNFGQNPVTTNQPGSGNWFKWYGTVAAPSTGCGIVYWNHSKQAAYFVRNSNMGGNVASSAQGSTTYASSTLSANHPASAVIDGNRRGDGWGAGGGWSSSAPPTASAPQIITVQFPAAKTISEIEVVTLQDAYSNPIEPTTATTFSATSGVGIRNFLIQYFTGSAWVTAATVTNNVNVVRRVAFTPASATHVRLWITGAVGANNARVVELSAYEDANTAAAPYASQQIFVKYANLGYAESPTGLGYPTSNMVPPGWTNTAYQLFDKGVITYHPTYGAKYVGGPNPEDQALARALMAVSGVSEAAAGSPAIYPLTSDPKNTCISGFAGCNSAAQTGAYATFRDLWWNLDGYVVARNGWEQGFGVVGPIAKLWQEKAAPANTATPWSSASLGFPIGKLETVGTAPNGQEVQNQQFERGHVTWQPSDCGTATTCSNPAPSPNAAGCTVYGTRNTNYVAVVPLTSKGPLIGAGSPGMFCGAPELGPSCIQSAQVATPYTGPTGVTGLRGIVHCSADQHGADGITLRWIQGTASYWRLVAEPIFSKWRSGESIQDAITHRGLPAQDRLCITGDLDPATNDCGMTYQNFSGGGSHYVQNGVASDASTTQIKISTAGDHHTFSLSASLDNAPGCGAATDLDDDCLDDTMEAQLGYLMAPRLIYDTNENHGPGNHPLHDKRLDMIQVRPWTKNRPLAPTGDDKAVSTWSSDPSSQKWIAVRMIMAYPWQQDLANHIGDTEAIELHLYSEDSARRVWNLYGAYFTHHGYSNWKGPHILSALSDNLRSPYLNIVVEAGNHGSWEGMAEGPKCSTDVQFFLQACYDSPDNGGYGSMLGSKDFGNFWWFDARRNVGEPMADGGGSDHYTSAHWPTTPPPLCTAPPCRPPMIDNTAGDSRAVIWNDTGHGYTAEYLGTAWPLNKVNDGYPPKTLRSCGWKCPERTTSGNCHEAPHPAAETTECDDANGFSFPLNGSYVYDNNSSSNQPFGGDFAYQLWGSFNHKYFTK